MECIRFKLGIQIGQQCIQYSWPTLQKVYKNKHVPNKNGRLTWLTYYVTS